MSFEIHQEHNKVCSVYIAGPMSGLPQHNYPAFHEMESILRKMGYSNILNPAKIANGDTSKQYSYYIRESLKLVSQADFVVFLDGWEKSKGANLEKHCADAMGINCYSQSFVDLNKAETVCQEADRLVSHDRQKTYGHPKNNFSDIADGWNVITKDGITPEKVGLMMIWVKICRELHLHKRDNLTDICGFAKTVMMVYENNTK